jgi:TMEM175 potassium channel family protein
VARRSARVAAELFDTGVNTGPTVAAATERAIQLDELIKSLKAQGRKKVRALRAFAFAPLRDSIFCRTASSLRLGQRRCGGTRMNTNRLNSFTDGVIAIIITIMVLALPVPQGSGLGALMPLGVLFAAYALSFVKVGIYWSQNHHMLQAATKVDGRVLLANLFFLFWLSLVPFIVRWVGEAGITRDTVLAFGVDMLLCAISFALLRAALIACNGRRDSSIAKATARGKKGVITIVAYLIAIGLAFAWPYLAIAVYLAVAAIWLVPDKRFERLVG